MLFASVYWTRSVVIHNSRRSIILCPTWCVRAPTSRVMNACAALVLCYTRPLCLRLSASFLVVLFSILPYSSWARWLHVACCMLRPPPPRPVTTTRRASSNKWTKLVPSYMLVGCTCAMRDMLKGLSRVAFASVHSKYMSAHDTAVSSGDSEKLLEFVAVNGSRLKRLYRTVDNGSTSVSTMMFLVVSEPGTALAQWFMEANRLTLTSMYCTCTCTVWDCSA